MKNVLNALPTSVHPAAKRALAEIRDAEDKDHALAAIEAFKADYQAKWPKAVAKIVDDTEVLLAFFDFPAEHSAPRGALTYPLLSREGLEVISLGPMAHLDSKDEGDSSMPFSRLSRPGVWGEEAVDPRDMAKA